MALHVTLDNPLPPCHRFYMFVTSTLHMGMPSYMHYVVWLLLQITSVLRTTESISSAPGQMGNPYWLASMRQQALPRG